MKAHDDQMVLAAHQTQYLPYLGVIRKIDKADIFVAQDNVQYSKQEWQNRNRIRTGNGWRYLTIPVHFTSSSLICDVTPAEGDWVERHRRIFDQEYARAPFKGRVDQVWDLLGDLRTEPLSTINYQSIKLLLEIIGIDTKTILASDRFSHLDVADANSRLIAYCKECACEVYLSGEGGKSYIDEAVWTKEGIRVVWDTASPEPYAQAHQGWTPDLSVVDLIANVEEPLSVLRPT